MHRDVLADVFPRDDLLLQHRGGASLELVTSLLLLPLVRLDVISQQRRLILGDDADVHVGARA